MELYHTVSPYSSLARQSFNFNLIPSLTCLVRASLLPNGGCLTVDERGPLIWSPDSPRWSLPSVGFIRFAVPSELLPHKLLQSDDCWMSSDRRRICSAVNYSARSVFTSLREVWGPLASPLSADPAVSHHQSLASRPAHFLTYYGAQGQSSSAAEPEIEAFCRSTGVPGSPGRFLPKFWLIPRPRDNLPSHLTFIQTLSSNHRAAAAFSSVSLTGFPD